MLTVIGLNASAEGTLSVDRYVPFAFRSGEHVRGNPVTWRYRDDIDGLLEFKIDRESGEVYGITLVGSARPLADHADLPCDHFEPEPGLPIVDANAVRGDVFDQKVVVRLLRRDDHICLVWGNWGSSTACLSVDRACFFLRDDALTGVCFGPLSDVESSTIENWNRRRQTKCAAHHDRP